MAWTSILACADCDAAIELTDISPVKVQSLGPEELALFIHEHHPNLVDDVQKFCRDHRGHNFMPMAIQPLDEYEKSLS